MQVLRRGGEHLEAREYWRWAALAVVFVGLLTLVAATYRLVGPGRLHIVLLPALVLTVVMSSSIGRIVRRLHAVRAGRLGESLVTELVNRLPDDYYLVNDVVLGRGNIDHVVVGPCGVVVIETKRVAGRIRCDGDRWFVQGRPVRSYSRQAKAAAVAVKAFLTERHPDLRGTFVQAVVVFTHPHCQLEVNRAEVAVARFSQMLPFIVELSRHGGMDPWMARTAAQDLAAAALASRSVASGPRRARH